jgi:FkbM family methyltransferase
MGVFTDKINTSLMNPLGVHLIRYRPTIVIEILNYFDFDTVIDVGANTGQFAKSILEAGFTGNIFSVEPSNEAFNRLVSGTKKYRNWQVIPRCAVGAAQGEVKLNISENLYSSSLLEILSTHTSAAPRSRYVSEEFVPMETLDRLFDSESAYGRNCFLKLDVQGFEDQVLAGGKKLMEQIGGIKIELSLLPLYYGQPLHQELLSNIESKGFTLWNIEPGFSDLSSGQTFQYDAVLIHKSLLKK